MTTEHAVNPAHFSHSQLSHLCDLQTKYHRERVKTGRIGIATVYGSALHKGLEAWSLARIDGRVAAADADIGDEIEYATAAAITELGIRFRDAKKAGTPVILDGEPRLKKNGEPYADSIGNIQSRETAESMLTMHVREYLKTWAPTTTPQSAERQIDITMKDPEGRVIRTVIDRIDEDTTVIDYKSARNPWSAERLEQKKPQAYLYMAAFVQEYGIPPKAFEFHVFSRTSPAIAVWPVVYEPAAINRYLTYVVRPKIAAIEAGIFPANTDGWHCSERWCDYWQHCPMGAAAHPEAAI